MIADPIGIPACFSSGSDRVTDDPAVTRAGQSVVMSVYRTKVGNQSRLITITWCRNPLLLLHGLSVSISGPGSDGGGEDHARFSCKVELKPWYFWRKQGSKNLTLDDGKNVDVFWDLKSAKFQSGETEPSSDYYVAVVDHDQEVVLLLGDLKNEAYKKTGCRPALIDPVLVSKKEHIFGKKRFFTRAKFHDKGKFHEILIECRNNNHRVSNGEGSGSGSGPGPVREPEMEVRVDGQLVIHVKHLQWKFRGNESIYVNGIRVEVYWDVHDWLFSPGLRHALFIFKPVNPSPVPASPSSLSSLLSSSPSSTTLSSLTGSSGSVVEGSGRGNGSSDFSLFLHAWKIE